MPGICGFVDLTGKDVSADATLVRMVQFHKTRSTFQTSSTSIQNIYSGYAQPGQVYSASQYFASKESVYVWFDGELYNQEELPCNVVKEKGADASVVLNLYLSDNEMPFLEVVDGTFTTVIYDQPRQKIVVACDRYGLQHIHWTQSRNYFAWATEYKSLTVLSDFAADIDTNALNDFIKYGYLTEDRTWFKSVNLLNGATVLSFDVNTHERITRRYWSWEKIKILDNLVDERECTEEWGRRFKEAVNRRMFPHRRIGVTLSGGLDSRAILAAMPVPEDNIHTFTFGVQDCDDIRIASQVASLKGTIHQNCYLDKAAWLDKNVAAVWATDGEIALLDTNGNEFLSFIEGYIDICMNGFGGDALHGGSFLGMKNQHVTTTDDPYGFRGRRYIRHDRNAHYGNYIKREKIITLWENHLGGKHATTLVNRYATFELWLQQIFEQKYRCFEN